MGEEAHLRVGSPEWWERGLSAGPQHALDDARWPNGEHKIAAQALPADAQVAAHFSLEPTRGAGSAFFARASGSCGCCVLLNPALENAFNS